MSKHRVVNNIEPTSACACVVADRISKLVSQESWKYAYVLQLADYTKFSVYPQVLLTIKHLEKGEVVPVKVNLRTWYATYLLTV